MCRDMPEKLKNKVDCPEKVYIELTTDCDLSCKICTKTAGRKKSFIDTIEWKDIIDDLASFGVGTVVFTGGDPLVREDLVELAFYCTFQEIKVIIETNGTKITTEKAVELKNAGVSMVNISIDGSNAEKHDMSRGIDGYFTRALNGFQALRNAGVLGGFNTAVTTKNADDLKSIIELAERLGAKFFNLFLMLPGNNCIGFDEQNLMEPEKCRELMEWLWNVSRKSNMDLRVQCSPQYVKVIEKDERDISSFGYNKCPAGISMAYVSHSGDVFPCPHIDIVCGNVRKKSFKYIWEKSREFQKLRNIEESRGDCDVCEVSMECSGCMSEPFLKRGEGKNELKPLCSVFGESVS